MMEMFAITHMIDKEVPIETMVDFFSQTPGFQEAYTRDRIKQYISRSYNPVNCEKIWQQADQFCLHDSCQLWLNANAK
jgi:DNA primase large subunit